MAYRSHHCSATLRCSVCISVFCTLLVFFVLLPFMLSAPCPFDAPFPFCAFLLLRFASCFTPHSHPTATTSISSFLCILIVYVLLMHAICTKLLMSSTLPDHHCSSSAFLAVQPMRPTSLGVMLRFLNLSSSRDSSSSLS
jgi:hypothetical protein